VNVAANSVAAVRYLMRSPLPPVLKKYIFQLAFRQILYRGLCVVGHDRVGNSIACDTSEFMQCHIAVFGVWEPQITHYLLSKERTQGIFIDVGANIGYYSLLASKIFNRVIAFEPAPRTFAALCNNIKLNKLNNVSSVKVALSKRREERPFYQLQGFSPGQGSLLLRERSTFDSVVQCAPINEFVTAEDWPNVRVIKIDVEGTEPDVVTTILECRRHFRKPLDIIIENDVIGDKHVEMFHSLLGAGFTAFDLHSAYRLDDFLSFIPARATPIFELPAHTTDCLFRLG
jgi:FkbM family methyltransferase